MTALRESANEKRSRYSWAWPGKNINESNIAVLTIGRRVTESGYGGSSTCWGSLAKKKLVFLAATLIDVVTTCDFKINVMFLVRRDVAEVGGNRVFTIDLERTQLIAVGRCERITAKELHEFTIA